MATYLRDFLKLLATDDEQNEAFKAADEEGKRAIMNEHGVSLEQQDAILSRDPEQLAAAVGNEVADDQDFEWPHFW